MLRLAPSVRKLNIQPLKFAFDSRSHQIYTIQLETFGKYLSSFSTPNYLNSLNPIFDFEEFQRKSNKFLLLLCQSTTMIFIEIWKIWAPFCIAIVKYVIQNDDIRLLVVEIKNYHVNF